MTSRRLTLVLVGIVASASVARGEEAVPGRTLALDHGFGAGIASAMSGGSARDGRLAFGLPRQPPAQRAFVEMPGQRPRGPVVDADGRVFVGTVGGVAIVEPDGSERREVAVGVLDCAPVLVPGGDVIALSRDGALARLAPDGLARRRASTGLAVRFGPLVEPDGSLVTAVASRQLVLLGSDLEVRATRELPDGPALSPARTARGRYAVAAGSELVVLDPEGLAIVRSIVLPGRAATPPAASADGSIWIATVDGVLVRVRAEARVAGTSALGGRLPEAASSDRAMLGVAPDGDVLAVVPARGLVRVAPDGSERWTWASDTPLVGAISVDPDGRAAVVDRLGHLSVISASGEREWSLALEGMPLGPAIVTGQGRVVVATERGVVILGPD